MIRCNLKLNIICIRSDESTEYFATTKCEQQRLWENIFRYISTEIEGLEGLEGLS